MADLTVTPERQKVVDFVDPWIAGVDEIIVTRPGGPDISTVDDLSGKEVFVRGSSSYYQSLLKLNARLTSEGKAPVTLTPAPEELEDEDLMETANAGLVDILVVDNHKAWFWQRVWPAMKLHPTMTLRSGGEIAWAIRKDSPQLKAALNRFLSANARNSLNAWMIFRRYLLNTQYVKSAAADAARKRFISLVALFRKYGAQYDMDWMLMAAQGYQESRLDHSARSHVGAIGVMQVMPATGAELGVGDIKQLEPNIHAGVKYVRTVVDRSTRTSRWTTSTKCCLRSPPITPDPGVSVSSVAKPRRGISIQMSGSTTSSASPPNASAGRLSPMSATSISTT
jgi:membrane-bound lytic murein transglycosylase MltF